MTGPNIIFKQLALGTKNYATLFEIIHANNGQARFVGGCVRDGLLGIKSKDFDVITDLLPQKIMDIMQQNNIQVIPIGIKYGTVMVIIEGEKFEVTTLRQDIGCDGRWATVEYSKSFQQDALRRDFTINALSYCPIKHEIYDYCNGMADLVNFQVRFIGDASIRIQEDYLRILRFFRFSCRIAGAFIKHENHITPIDKEGLAACIMHRGKLQTLSKERIKNEMDGLCKLPNHPYYLKIMHQQGILEILWGIKSYDYEAHAKIKQMQQNSQTRSSLSLCYAIMFLEHKELTQSYLLDLRFSKQEATKIMLLLDAYKAVRDGQNAAYLIKKQWLHAKGGNNNDWYDYVALFACLYPQDSEKYLALYHQLDKMPLPQLPVSAQELIDMGFVGPALGMQLKQLEQEWIESDFTLNKEELLNKIQEK
jgi:poly(A) polymerase